MDFLSKHQILALNFEPKKCDKKPVCAIYRIFYGLPRSKDDSAAEYVCFCLCAGRAKGAYTLLLEFVSEINFTHFTLRE